MSKKQASPSINGWLFQAAAGIWIFFDKIKYVKNIKMEGETEDIEIEFNDGTFLFAQAKSVYNIDDVTNDKSILKKALKSLESISFRRNINSLVYVTNRARPVHTEIKGYFSYDQNYYSYHDLPNNNNERSEWIDAFVSDNFPKDKFKILMIHFFGDEEEKYSKIKKKIEEFLAENKLNPSYSREVFRTFKNVFIDNCADQKIDISKEKAVYLIIYVFIRGGNGEVDYEKLEESIEYDLIEDKYKDYIDYQSCDYQFVTKVIGDFSRKKNEYNNNRFDYISENWKNYEEDFEVEEDVDLRRGLIKVVLSQILKQRFTINKVKDGAGL